MYRLPRVAWILSILFLCGPVAAGLADDAARRLEYGAQLRAAGNPQEALAWVDHAFRLQPSYEAQLERGRVWFDLEQFDLALQDFRAASRTQPGSPEPHWLQAKVWWKKGELEAAESEFCRALEEQADYYPALLHRGYLRLAREDAARALADGELAVQLQPEQLAGYALRGRARQEVGDLIGAEIDFDYVVERSPDDLEAYVRRAEARLALQDLAGAWEDAAEIWRRDPQQAQVFRLRASVYRASGNAAQAEQELQSAVRLATPESLPTILLDRALTRLALGRGPDAIADLAEAIRLAPDRKVRFTRTFEAALRSQGR